MGFTTLSRAGVNDLLDRLEREWPGANSHRRDFQFADALSPSLLTHQLKVEGRRQQNDSLVNRLGVGYDLLSRNCCNFADAFLVALGVGQVTAVIWRQITSNRPWGVACLPIVKSVQLPSLPACPACSACCEFSHPESQLKISFNKHSMNQSL